MRWYMDTEFDENGSIIKLISIALVSERGDHYYRVLSDGWTREDCDPWVQKNVLPLLPARGALWADRTQVAMDLRYLLLRHGQPEIWAYFADYDWVAFCQLFGKMVDLPTGFPMFCMDLKQEMQRRGMRREDIPVQQAEGTAHDALADAQWVREAHLWLESKR